MPPSTKSRSAGTTASSCASWRDRNSSAGFTLVEVLVVAAITGAITTFMLITFARGRIDLDQVRAVVAADIRAAQAEATASAKFQGAYRCGYGIRYVGNVGGKTYALYAGPDASNPAISCASENRNFDANDTDVKTVTLSDFRAEFRNPFPDIFFEPPDPKTYLDNNASLGASPERILVAPNGVGCMANPGKCGAVCVYTSGKIELPPVGTLVCP